MTVNSTREQPDEAAGLPIDQRMLLQTIRNAGLRPISATELQHHWSPAWTLSEVMNMLSSLKKRKLVTFSQGRYTATHPVTQGNLLQTSHGRTYWLQERAQ